MIEMMPLQTLAARGENFVTRSIVDFYTIGTINMPDTRDEFIVGGAITGATIFWYIGRQLQHDVPKRGLPLYAAVLGLVSGVIAGDELHTLLLNNIN